MSKSASYQPCRQLEGDENNCIEFERQATQILISPSSTIPEQLECHVEPLNLPSRCTTRSRIALAIISTVLVTFTVLTITAAKAKTSQNHRFGLFDSEGLLGEQQALGATQESVLVDTPCGKLIGDEEHGAFVFKGIPYAMPPTGSRRWSPPMPLMNDSSYCHKDGNRHATKFGSSCFQVNPFTKQYEGREDCLYLNIWTSNTDPEAHLPVMVWIHGGFLQFGSGHQPGLRPTGKLAKSTNAVFVSINYRLHAFGFLSLDLLLNNNTNSTNFGIMDVVMALKWIQANIHLFGGDANRVHLFGPDAGGTIILALNTNPEAKQLFNSSWVIDPALYFNRTNYEASKHNEKNFLRHSGCDSVECLRSLPPQKVLENFLGKNDPSFRINDQNDLPILGIMTEQFITIDDLYVFDSYPFENTNFDKPLLIGSSAQAIEFWPGPRDLNLWSWRDYNKYVTTSLDSFGHNVSRIALQLYAPVDDGNETTPALQYIQMVSDLRQLCPVNFVANNMALKSNSSSIHRYVINAKPSKPIHLYDYPSSHSFHLLDAISFFDQLDVFIRHPTLNDYSIRDSIQQIVNSFINSSNSSSYSLWQSFPHQMAEIVSQENVTSIVSNSYHQSDRCSFWQMNTLFNYSWTV